MMWIGNLLEPNVRTDSGMFLATSDCSTFTKLMDDPRFVGRMCAGGFEYNPTKMLEECNIFVHEDGLVGFQPFDDRTSEIHAAFGQEVHPVRAMRHFRDAMHCLFTKTNTTRIIAKTANKFITDYIGPRVGLRKFAVRADGKTVMVCDLIDWIMTHPVLQGIGMARLEQDEIETEYQEFNRILGATVLTGRFGQAQKVLELYHSIAPAFGFPQLHVASWEPFAVELVGITIVGG